MNNYHVYEAIGAGKHSTVYKGRKKSTIEYFAIKSVDKSQRSKVSQEVKMLHSLDHENVLKFYAWYDTPAHLWLILEYCVGGDLMTILEMDKRLPEDSVHDLARDLVKALQYLHSKGIIYCDLKPSNILLDENGRVKLCDFGLARPLSDLEKNKPSMLPHSKRGTPCYMAPELFLDGGVYSFASDFWALGCVLYECISGSPPFVGKEFTQLVGSILSDPLPPLPENTSSSFQNLLNCLLKKDPSERIHWPELCQHSFWKTKFNIPSLPPNMVEEFAKPCLAERNGDKPTEQDGDNTFPDRTPRRCHENNVNEVCRQDENKTPGPKSLENSSRNIQGARKAKNSAKAIGKQKEASHVAKGVNILRLSRMAKLNLQRQNEKINYRRPMPNTCENDVEVKIENNDMELDFSENVEDDAPNEADPLDNPDDASGEKMLMQNAAEGTEIEHSMEQSNMPIEHVSVESHDLKHFEQNPNSEQVKVASTPPSFGIQRKAHQMKMASENVPDPATARPIDVSEVFWHPSDLSVKPVMPSRKASSEAIPHLPFEGVQACDFAKLSTEKMDILNGRIIQALSGNSQVSEKQNIIRYIEILSGNADAASIITNGLVMQFLVRMLRLSKTSVLRAQITSAIALLIRHATTIGPDVANFGIMNALTDGLRDKQDKVRRFSMAALGELLFYISTLKDNDMKENDAVESPSKDIQSSCWQVNNSTIALVSSVLRKGEDDIAQLYALRTIENICSQGVEWVSRFSNQDVIGNLCYIYKATGKQENTRLIAGSCLVRIGRFNPSNVHVIFEKLSFKYAASSIIKGNPREQQICLNLLNMAIFSSHTFTNMGRNLLSLAEEKQLVPTLISFVEQGGEVLRGKSLIFIALLCKASRRWLPLILCNSKLLSAVDRLAKGKDEFLQKCMEAFVEIVATTVPGILETVSGDIQQLMGGKRHGPIAALTGRSNPKSTNVLFPLLLHLFGSSCFKQRLVNSHLLLQLATLIKLLESPFQGRDDFQITLLQIFESISEESSFILRDHKTFTSRILPSLALLYRGYKDGDRCNKDGDARFLCLKIMFDVIVVILSETPDSSAANDDQTVKDLHSIAKTHFLRLYPSFIEDEDPIPVYAQKLLLMLIDFNYVKVSDILHMKTVSQCYEFFHGDLSNTNVNNVKLCLALASAPELETRTLTHLRIVRKIGNFLEFVYAKEMEDFLEPTLGLCKAFILRGIGSTKAIAYYEEPALLRDAAFDKSIAVDQQECITDIADFCSSIGLFLELICYPVANTANLASECVVLLLKAAPRESTMGILTNLPKVCVLMEFLHQSHATLALLRLLHGVSFSCQQYFSQAMILSISIPATTRIAAFISGLKDSSSPSVVIEAAKSLSLELQRLLTV